MASVTAEGQDLFDWPAQPRVVLSQDTAAQNHTKSIKSREQYS